ncbi:hypothetical protein NS19R_19615 [Enterobacter hormaechei subsp. xiangfangensis]|nr:hypothetical protein NS19R_19615 [Enterobacter hormaechei subsp. xiangfangensis]KTR20231.1 hypothetical protein NS64R_19000 [Enterobacter hormaechei subsp. xiangfangensis]
MDLRQTAKVVAPQWADFRMLTVGSSQIHFIAAQKGIASNHVIHAIEGIAFKTGRSVEHGVDKNELRGIPETFGLKPQ